MTPRKRKQHQKSDADLEQEWKDELPMAEWRVRREGFEAHFTAHKGKVVKTDRTIEVLLGLTLTSALETCWDRGCKTTILPPEEL